MKMMRLRIECINKFVFYFVKNDITIRNNKNSKRMNAEFFILSDVFFLFWSGFVGQSFDFSQVQDNNYFQLF